MPYPLSPHDLAAYDRLPELIAAGVRALKIEGRLKPPEYVASATRQYRTALDDVSTQLNSGQIAEMEAIFSRGFCHGWLDDDGCQTIVSGQSSDKRGILLGEVRGVRGTRILVELTSPVRRGDGLMFESDQNRTIEQGGRVYEIFQNNRSIENEVTGGQVEMAFRHDTIDFSQIYLGQRVWKTDDPQAVRRIRKTYAGVRPQRHIPLDLTVEAVAGHPMQISATADTGVVCRFESPEPLVEATKHPLTTETLTEQFGRLGNTPYELRRLVATIEGQPMLPLSVLGKLRRELMERLEAAASQIPSRTMAESSALSALRAEDSSSQTSQISNFKFQISDPKSQISNPKFQISDFKSQIHVLCRSLQQIEAALACGASNVIADLQELSLCGDAVRAAHAGNAKILLATPRIHKPGETDVFKLLASVKPDGVLIRNLAGMAFFRSLGLPMVADFSLNAVNDLTIRWLHDQGAERITAAYDLNGPRLLDLAGRVPPEWLEVVIHQHTPMFHSEYCVFQGILSQGTSRRDCGRPCLRHDTRLRDRRGVEHRLLADSQCRNTLFHAEAQNLSALVPELRDRGVQHFRVELLAENTVDEVRRVFAPFQPQSSGC
jgi:putative protease